MCEKSTTNTVKEMLLDSSLDSNNAFIYILFSRAFTRKIYHCAPLDKVLGKNYNSNLMVFLP